MVDTSKLRSIPLSQIEAAMDGGCDGFCLSCGAEADGVEPDAREYQCEVCGKATVYGAEEILIMGNVDETE